MPRIRDAVVLALSLHFFGCGGPPEDTVPSPVGVSEESGQNFSEEGGGWVVAGDMQFDLTHYENVVEMLRARAPGVQVVGSGAGMELRIRGMTQSLGGNSGQGPLVVVDGMPSSRGDEALFSLNPVDVAKITVLRDVASTAIYGTRGANGVILVQTRKRS